jgi:hypothetical protein
MLGWGVANINNRKKLWILYLVLLLFRDESDIALGFDGVTDITSTIHSRVF